GQGKLVLVAGLAGMVASALSMGSSAYLAAKSEKEVMDSELQRERVEIEEDPDEEKRELELIYKLKSFSDEEAAMLVDRLSKNPEDMLTTLAHEELGISRSSLPNPWTSMASASLSTAIGAAIPLAPFFFMSGMPAVYASLIISLLAHFAVGALKSILTSRSWFSSGMEMTLVGVIVSVATYGLGKLLEGMGLPMTG
ncbi:MAG: VIT1/CCC1 transporter family protein, partial [Armatimonadota bacterium]